MRCLPVVTVSALLVLFKVPVVLTIYTFYYSDEYIRTNHLPLLETSVGHRTKVISMATKG